MADLSGSQGQLARRSIQPISRVDSFKMGQPGQGIRRKQALNWWRTEIDGQFRAEIRLKLGPAIATGVT